MGIFFTLYEDRKKHNEIMGNNRAGIKIEPAMGAPCFFLFSLASSFSSPYFHILLQFYFEIII
jgi:hypothetical protein